MASRLIVAAVIAYGLGSIPFGYILVKLFLQQDIRQTGSGNIGATNVARSGKKGLALATLLLDAGKGTLAVLLARQITDRLYGYSEGAGGVVMALAALGAVVGHCFPVWLRFKGGKGVATAIGAFAVIDARASLIAVVVFGLVFGVTRYVSLSSIISAAVFPVAAYFSLQPTYWMTLVGLMSATSFVIIAKHHANMRRLLAGTEPKFGKKAIGWNDPAVTEKNL